MSDDRVEKYMPPIDAAILRHLNYGAEFTDIYNRAYEAISLAIDEQEAKLKRQLAAANEDAERLAVELKEQASGWEDGEHYSEALYLHEKRSGKS
jgi:lipid II:glycine glycyltransferase (peptidoglycan interpeptide bridge formation enzyme)